MSLSLPQIPSKENIPLDVRAVRLDLVISPITSDGFSALMWLVHAPKEAPPPCGYLGNSMINPKFWLLLTDRHNPHSNFSFTTLKHLSSYKVPNNGLKILDDLLPIFTCSHYFMKSLIYFYPQPISAILMLLLGCWSCHNRNILFIHIHFFYSVFCMKLFKDALLF